MNKSIRMLNSRRWLRSWQLAPLFLLLVMSYSRDSVAETLQAEIQLEAARAGTIWVGQELELNLELWSTGVSFSGQQFSLPQITGAYLLQADSSTIKLNEKRDGQAWQGLRYTLLLYPQRQGLIEIPPFDVRFSASDSFVGDSEDFRFTSEPLSIEAALPPGVDAGGLVITTSDFELVSSWEPGQSGEAPLQLKTGDALHLTIERRAADVPAMVFSPLPEFAIDGLRAYTKAPVVNDRINRGELAGARTDSLTFICEQAGSYRIPDINFQWWNPDQQLLNEEVVPGLEFKVVPNPAYGESQTNGADTIQESISGRDLLWVILLLLVLLVVGWWCTPRLKTWLQNKRAERELGEDWAFQQVLEACEHGQAGKAYQASCLWLSRFRPHSGAVTLHQLAQGSGDRELEMESERLQRAVASGSNSDWQGQKLGELLGKVRGEKKQSSSDREKLPPLNPVSG